VPRAQRLGSANAVLMAKIVDVKISGLSEIQEKLEHLPIKASRTIMRRSLRVAAQIWVDEMKSRVRRGPHHFKGGFDLFGVIAKTIGMRLKVNSDLQGSATVGVPKKVFWARFVEFGTKVRFRGKKSGGKRTGGTTGQMPAFPFARPAFEAKKQEVLDKFKADLKQALEEAGLKFQ
jgi:HK97 gp10 family phage protein